MIKVNGQTVELEKETSILQYIKKAGYNVSQIAVEYNEEIISKDAYDTTMLSDGGVLEIVTFMGGGSC